jgi:hypothetical protein
VIKVCTDENSAKPSDIVICNDEDTPDPQDIKVCTDDGRLSDPCSGELPELTLTGSSTPVVGESSAQYTASGGVGDISYSFDAGTISSSGLITAIDSCGASGSPRWATVTATDSCGQSASIVVRLPSGQWVTLGTCYPGYSSCAGSPHATGVQTLGAYQYQWNTRCCDVQWADCTGPVGVKTGTCPPFDPYEVVDFVVTAEWQCP